MEAYCENVVMPFYLFPIKSFTTSTMEHVIEVHPHWHTEIEILYFINGQAKQQVNENIFHAENGDIVIIGKDQLHSTYAYENNICEVLVIQFDAHNILGPFINNSDIDAHFDFSNETIYENPIKTDSNEGQTILKSIIEIHEELRNNQIAYESMVKAALFRFAGTLARYGLYKVNRTNHDNMQYIHSMLEKTFKLIDECYSEEISLRKAALTSNLSVTHFCRLFKKATGMTFYDYLTFYRVNRAEKMLNTSRKMAEITFQCGFGSVSSFIRSFKKFKNCAPSKYK